MVCQITDQPYTIISQINDFDILSDKRSENDLNIIIDDVVDIIFRLTNKGKERKVKNKHILDCLNNHNITSKEIYDWLLNNQINPNSIFLLGYFNYSPVEISVNYEKGFKN